MSAVRRILLTLGCVGSVGLPVHAHPVPFSYIDVRVDPAAVDLTIVAHTFDLANDLKIQPPEQLLERNMLNARESAIRQLLEGRLRVSADDIVLTNPTWSSPEVLPQRQIGRAHV